MRRQIPLGNMLHRRILVGSAIGAGLTTAGIVRIGRAQTDSGTDSGTPEASESGPTVDSDDEQIGDDAGGVVSEIERAGAALAYAHADREAVGDQIDTAIVDELLSQSVTMLDDAQVSFESGDTEQASLFAHAAGNAARTASGLVVAQLTHTGLPSHEASTSRELARTHERITAVSEATASSTEVDVSFYVTTAQALYQTAYDQFNEGNYAQAAANGKATGSLVGIASILTGDRSGFGGPNGMRGDRGSRRGQPMMKPDDEATPALDEPETVPAPDF